MDPKLLQQVKEVMRTDPAAAAEMIKDYLEEENNIPLNIAITGESGSGKSSFINAFRGMSNMDEGAAPTGVVETTSQVQQYPHPNYPNVVLWDLPGVGTTRFPADQYLKKVGFQKFDFFIIISDTRFRENDVKLAREIKKMKKKFYFVRSKIDIDLQNQKRSQRDFSAEKTLKQIRDDCVKGLQQQGLESPQVFLLSNFDLHLYDFGLLQETLERELPEHQRHALLLSIPNISLEVINKKKKAFQTKIKFYATASAAVAAVPIPGLSTGVDLALMVGGVIQYKAGFSLNESSLQKLSARTGVPFNDLTAVLKSELALGTITAELLLKLILSLSIVAVSMVAEEASRFIPVFGIPAAMALSFTTTYKALNHFLDVLADDAQRVFQRSLGLNPSE